MRNHVSLAVQILYWKQEIAMLEEELKLKNEIIKKQEMLIEGWRKELEDQLDKHTIELERVWEQFLLC